MADEQKRALELDLNSEARTPAYEREQRTNAELAYKYEVIRGGRWRTVHVLVELLVAAVAVLAIISAYDSRARIGGLELELRTLHQKVCTILHVLYFLSNL